mmetsp:Transcript_54876/g.164244  ORF Transcript_54876/g.164244 Transcript_54876/m.164244 type:complete len:220 (+) Transcript_54876:1019-1678(+)
MGSREGSIARNGLGTLVVVMMVVVVSPSHRQLLLESAEPPHLEAGEEGLVPRGHALVVGRVASSEAAAPAHPWAAQLVPRAGAELPLDFTRCGVCLLEGRVAAANRFQPTVRRVVPPHFAQRASGWRRLLRVLLPAVLVEAPVAVAVVLAAVSLLDGARGAASGRKQGSLCPHRRHSVGSSLFRNNGRLPVGVGQSARRYIRRIAGSDGIIHRGRVRRD